ncbi:MAG: sulfur carrier protein ThiS [Ketobacteraceae bacterium]|nr:sulfur carrier protein ThiS [Ketobacteraceae bacterium]
MTVTINGEPQQIAPGSTVADLIARMALTGKRLAVERNQEIVPKSIHDQVVLQSADVIEIVHAIGGG